MPTSKTQSPTAAAMTYREAYSTLKYRQKPGPGVPAYTRWVNRRGARYVAAGAYRAGLGPNGVTLLSALFSAVGIITLLALPRAPLTGLAVAVLLAAGYLLDSADGQVARLRKMSNPAGEWFDHVVDAIRMPSIHLATLIALYFADTSHAVLLFPIIFTIVNAGQFLSQILAEQLATRGSAPTPGRWQSLILLPTDAGTLCWLYLLWGFPLVFNAGYGLLLALNLLHSAVSMRRRFRQLSTATPSQEARD